MDFDILISVIVWVLVIVASVISSKKKKSKAEGQHRQPHARKPAAVKAASAAAERWSAFDALMKAAAQEAKQAKPAPTPQTRKQKAAALPEEGIRATVRTTAPMAPNPKEKPWLADRKNLVNSLIYGEVLRPKF